MNKKVANVRAEHWRQTVYECLNRDPKLSKKQWCQENGIYYRSFMYWQRRFQLEAIDLMENHETTFPLKQDPVSVPVFADMTPHLEALQTEQESTSEEPESVPLAPELMIQAGDFRIYVNGSIQESTLKTVMRVIRHA
jgi:hypothetical protein